MPALPGSLPYPFLRSLMEWIKKVISRTIDCAKAGALLLFCLCSAGAQTWPNQISPKAAPKKFALVIGIDKYEIAPLFGCVKDAETFRDALINYGGFRRENIDMLADEAATYKAILKALVRSARESAAGRPIRLLLFRPWHALSGRTIRRPRREGRNRTA